MSHLFDIKLRSIPNEDIVQGYPGIKATWPRLEGVVEIRAKDGSAMQVSIVTAALYRTDLIIPPSNKPGINAPKREKSFLIGDKLTLFQTPAGKSYEELYAVDLPFILPLPVNKPVPASISILKGTIETTYQLFVTVIYGKATEHHIGFPIRIKRYDTLSTFGTYQVPIVKNVTSDDHMVTFEYSLPASSFGPTDTVTAFVKISPNLDYPKAKKVKLLRVTMQVLQVVQFKLEEPVEKRHRLFKLGKQLDLKLDGRGWTDELSFEFPKLDLRDKDGLIDKEKQDIPTVSRNGFTTQSSLYRVEYVLVLKARFSHAKDIEIEQPITVTPFDHTTCVSFMRSVAACVEYVNRVNTNARPVPRVFRRAVFPGGGKVLVC